VRALHNVSLKLGHGDRLGILGHNGAGKSTLLRVMAGVYVPAAGRVIIDGRVSPLFNTSPGLDIDDTGYENIVTCGMLLGMTLNEIKVKTPEIAEFTEHFKAHTIKEYGRTLLVEPNTVIEVAFDQVQKSARHKSGYALRFPRIVRLRPDKPVSEIDTLETVRQIAGR